MFIGTYNQKVDDKNRIIIPSKFRSKLSSGAVITIGNEGCLAIYSEDQWNKLIDNLENLSQTKADTRKYIRVISAMATECDCDSHGRVNLPNTLLKTIDNAKEIVVSGALSHIEIWSKEKWEIYSKESLENFDEISERL